jgi:hypothetical protein
VSEHGVLQVDVTGRVSDRAGGTEPSVAAAARTCVRRERLAGVGVASR